MRRFKILADNVIVHEVFHLIVALLTMAIVYRFFHSFLLSTLAFLIHFFIDTDHYFEGLLVNRLNIAWIFKDWPTHYWRVIKKKTIFFHSWELLPLVWFWGILSNQGILATTIIAGILSHYLVDCIAYCLICDLPIYELSFIFRALRKFEFKDKCPN